MEKFFDAFTALAQTKSIWIYVVIFFGELIVVSVSTLRIVLINRGIRLVGSLIGIVEVISWLIIVSSVLTSFHSDVFKMVAYALAFAMGNYFGSWLEEKLAFGLSNVQIVVSDMEEAANLVRIIREKGHGVTTLDVHGINENTRYMIMAVIRRKHMKEMIAVINEASSSAVVTVSDVTMQKGGYFRRLPGRHP